MFCFNCGKEIRGSNQNYCINCGIDLQNVSKIQLKNNTNNIQQNTNLIIKNPRDFPIPSISEKESKNIGRNSNKCFLLSLISFSLSSFTLLILVDYYSGGTIGNFLPNNRGILFLFYAFLIHIVGFILGIISLVNSKKASLREDNNAYRTIGIIIAIISMILCIVGLVYRFYPIYLNDISYSSCG